MRIVAQDCIAKAFDEVVVVAPEPGYDLFGRNERVGRSDRTVLRDSAAPDGDVSYPGMERLKDREVVRLLCTHGA